MNTFIFNKHYYETFGYPLKLLNALFLGTKEKQKGNLFAYEEIEIFNFKGIQTAKIKIVKNRIVLLLGLNESGKTSLLKAIEAFDYRNDLTDKNFLISFRNRADLTEHKPVRIKCAISLNSESLKNIKNQFIKIIKKENNIKLEYNKLEEFLDSIGEEEKILISRIIPFNERGVQPSYYQIESKHEFIKKNTNIQKMLAQFIVRNCPPIMYFEDFQDMIPNKIFVNNKSDAFHEIWYDIIDGLFFEAVGENYLVKNFVTDYQNQTSRPLAMSALNRVNILLNEKYTKRWKELSGVKDIKNVKLDYHSITKKNNYFEIKIQDKNGSEFSATERSKGAIWYLCFLMKAEFRKKKMHRDNKGKPVYLIDEPASNLHSTAQNTMLGDFQKLVEDTSVIYTTHSRHLVSVNNLATTYVVKRTSGKTSCIKWGEYIREKSAQQSYYQPLIDLLDIIPDDISADGIWKKALIVEGPSDAYILRVMYKIIYKKKLNFVIYVAGSASNMKFLISINEGWNTDFKVLLDQDKAGIENAEKYIKEFSLSLNENIFYHPKESKKIEDYFTQEDLLELRKITNFCKNGNSDVRKDEIRTIFSILLTEGKVQNASKLINEATKAKFEKLFSSFNFG